MGLGGLWSSVRAFLTGVDDALAIIAPELGRAGDFATFMALDYEAHFDALRGSEGTGRPVGSPEFVTGLERLLGRPIDRWAPGRKPNGHATGQLALLQKE